MCLIWENQLSHVMEVVNFRRKGCAVESKQDFAISIYLEESSPFTCLIPWPHFVSGLYEQIFHDSGSSH